MFTPFPLNDKLRKSYFQFLNKEILDANGNVIANTEDVSVEEMLSDRLQANFKSRQVQIAEKIQEKLFTEIETLDCQDIVCLCDALNRAIDAIDRADQIYADG